MNSHGLQEAEIHPNLKAKSLKALQGQIKKNEVWESYSRLSPVVWIKVVHDFCEEYSTEKTAKALLEVVQTAMAKLKESKEKPLQQQTKEAAQLMRFIQVNTWACIYSKTGQMQEGKLPNIVLQALVADMGGDGKGTKPLMVEHYQSVLNDPIAESLNFCAISPLAVEPMPEIKITEAAKKKDAEKALRAVKTLREQSAEELEKNFFWAPIIKKNRHDQAEEAKKHKNQDKKHLHK